MRVLTYFILLTLFSCSSGSQGKIPQKVNTTKAVAKTDTTRQEDDEEDVNFRQEFISLYHKPVHIDTFFVDNGKTFEVILNHYCTMDNGLVVPAEYNFDTNKDFTTHNFVSDLTMLADKDTIFKRHISKATFNSLLDTVDWPLAKYATLLYPDLNIINDSIQIDYSISIPVTDVGIGVNIKFDEKGNYSIKR